MMFDISRRKATRDVLALGAAAIALSFTTGASAQQSVKIGAIYPLSGNSASAGNYEKMAMEMGADIINNGNAELAKVLPLAKGGGLPGLKGAKIQMVFADNQGTPAAGQSQALRLITEEKVAALIGSYQSGITLTTSAVAEKYGIPFVNPESVAANLTERGFKWFFRVTPVAADFAKAYSDFLKEQKAAGHKIDSIALVHENTEYGNSVASVIADGFAKEGLKVNRFKGLGEMNPEQLWETTMNPENRVLKKVSLEDATAAEEMFSVLMGDRVEPRRDFIERNARTVKFLDV